MDKQGLRGELAMKRRRLSQDEVDEKSRVITSQIIGLIDWAKITKAHCYVPFAHSHEVDTRQLIRWMQQHGIDVAIPGVVVTQAELDAQYDLIIVPIVAFDSRLHRVGFGGGFYDRLLAAQTHARTVGVAYEMQRVQAIRDEPHDQPLQVVVTEETVYSNAQ